MRFKQKRFQKNPKSLNKQADLFTQIIAYQYIAKRWIFNYNWDEK